MNNSYPTISHFFFPFFYINYSQEKDWWISHSITITPTIIPPSLDQLIIHQRARNDPISRHGSNILSMSSVELKYIYYSLQNVITRCCNTRIIEERRKGLPRPVNFLLRCAQGVHAMHAIPHRGSLFHPESITWLGSRPILSVRERAPRCVPPFCLAS